MSTERKPQRIQRRRVKGWKMPPNTVYVGRPTKWGNPFVIYTEPSQLEGYPDYKRNVNLWKGWPCKDAATTVAAYREMVGKRLSVLDVRELRGKDLACWCSLDQPCHADVLLEIANSGAEATR